MQSGKQIEKPRVTVGKSGKFCRDVEHFPGISGCVPCRVRETFGLRTLLCARTARNFEGSDRNGKTDEKRFLKRCFTNQVDREMFPQKNPTRFGTLQIMNRRRKLFGMKRSVPDGKRQRPRPRPAVLPSRVPNVTEVEISRLKGTVERTHEQGRLPLAEHAARTLRKKPGRRPENGEKTGKRGDWRK